MKKLLVLLTAINLLLVPAAYAVTPLNDEADSSSGITVEKDASEDSSFTWSAGFSFIPFTNWQFIYSKGGEHLKYDIQSQSSAYEVNFRLWPFSFGVTTVVDDNITGRISQIIGYAGYDRFSVKISRSDLRGTGYWSGPYGYDTEPSFEINNKLQNVDLIYNVGAVVPDAPESLYFGFTYTEFKLPLQIYTREYAWNGGGGEPFYDENYGGKTYGLTFGFNMLKDKNKPQGWDIFALTQDRLTGGKYSLSDRAIRRGEALNPGYVIGEKETWGIYLDNETAIGLSWTNNFTEGSITFALGYDLLWGSIMNFPKGTGTQPAVLSWDQDNFFIRHGIIFCVYGTW